jgi:hypothetical protein
MKKKFPVAFCLFICLIVTVMSILRDLPLADLGLLLIFTILVFYPLGLYIKSVFTDHKDIDERGDGV